MEHNYNGPAYTIGIEEELMIVNSTTLELSNSIDTILGAVDTSLAGDVKPELMEAVLEISTEPCKTVREAGEQLIALRRDVSEAAARHGLAIGSAGTHPSARWEDQRIVAEDRYRGIIADLAMVARQELIFGMHVHVGIDDAEKAVHVANGMRVHVPILLALSANSPFWRADSTGLASARTPVFRAFPRVGIPPRYKSFSDYAARVAFMQEAGMIEDYTFLWYDVRLHPRFGTVEIRVMDSQTRIGHTLALAALVQSLVKELCEHYDSGAELSRYPFELLDENKWLGARHGLEGDLVDLPHPRKVATRELAERLVTRMTPHAKELGCEEELLHVRDLITRGTGAARQSKVWSANHDLRELMREIIEATSGANGG